MFRIISFLALTFVCVVNVSAEPFWGYKKSQSFNTLPKKLKPGQFIWKTNTTSTEPLSAKVNLAEQRIYVYRGSEIVGVSTVSTGQGKRKTPTGVFKVLEKDRHHKSDLYNNAPMPYMHRLTGDGIALHAGHLPGYPASHGCVRLPTQFVKLLFESSSVGMQVAIVKNDKTAPILAHTHKTTLPKSPTQTAVATLPIIQKIDPLKTTAKLPVSQVTVHKTALQTPVVAALPIVEKTVSPKPLTVKDKNTEAIRIALDTKIAQEEAKLVKLQQEIAVIEKKQHETGVVLSSAPKLQ
jgi:L,D-transpeptidase catalytic domain